MKKGNADQWSPKPPTSVSAKHRQMSTPFEHSWACERI